MVRSKYLIVISLFIGCLSMSNSANAQEYSTEQKKLLINANELYKNGEYEKAMGLYTEFIKKSENNSVGAFNLANALYRQQNYKEAAEQFEKYAAGLTNSLDKAKAYHNLGNSYLQNNELEKAIEAYQQALKYNSKDSETRYNLSYAMKKLQQKQQQQKQEEEKKSSEEKSPEDEKKEQEEKENNSENKDPQKDKEKDPNDKEGNQNNGEKKKSKEEAKKLLETLNDQEKKIQKKMNKEKESYVLSTKKDW